MAVSARMMLEASVVLDVEKGRKITDGFVLVEGETIRAWGPNKDRPPFPPDIEVRRFTGQTLLPGLINSHVHLCALSAGRPFYQPQSDEKALKNAEQHLIQELQSGVTTVRDCGDQNGVLFTLRKALSRGVIDGSDLVLCGPPLTTAGGHAHFLGGEVDGPDEIEHAVRKRHADGADFIKLIGTGGGTPGTHPDRAAYGLAELKVAVVTAHALKLPLAVHCRGTPGIVNALDAGVDQIEHACFEQPDGTLVFDPKLADRMARAGIFVTPTMQLYRDAFTHLKNKRAREELDTSEQAYFDCLPKIIAVKCQSLQGFLAAGVAVVAGNDAGLPHTGFGCFWRELDALVTGGMSAMQAIAAATIIAARAMGREDRIGQIGSGKQADLLIVDGDPTTDISALSRVRMVMRAGDVVYHLPGDDKHPV